MQPSDAAFQWLSHPVVQLAKATERQQRCDAADYADELFHLLLLPCCIAGSKVYLLQQRAPAICGRQQAFAENLASWTKQQHVSHVLFLCGLDSQYRKEKQLEGSQLRFWSATFSSNGNSHSDAASPDSRATQAAANSSQTVSSCGCHHTPHHQEQKHVEWYSSYQLAGCLHLEQDVVVVEREVHALLPPWPLLDAAAEIGLPQSLLTIFASEGDNQQDALTLAEKVLAVLQGQTLLPTATQEQHNRLILQLPCSWRGLYGERPVDLMLL
jgi:proteasome assembly chaperone 2